LNDEGTFYAANKSLIMYEMEEMFKSNLSAAVKILSIIQERTDNYGVGGNILQL
jgi:hypothetical protein